MSLKIIRNYAEAGVTAREHVLARGGPRRVVARPSKYLPVNPVLCLPCAMCVMSRGGAQIRPQNP